MILCCITLSFCHLCSSYQLLDTTIQNLEEVSTLLFQRVHSEKGKLGLIRVDVDSKGKFEAQESTDDVFRSDDENAVMLRQLEESRFPIVLVFAGRKTRLKPYIISLEDDILLKESPITVLGKCSFTATYITSHHSDPFRNPSFSTEMIPGYAPKKVRAASPIPIRVPDLQNFCKPRNTVHTLTEEQFEYLLKTIERNTSPERRSRLPTYPLAIPR